MKLKGRFLLTLGALAVAALCVSVGAPAVNEPPPVQVLVTANGSTDRVLDTVRAAGGRAQTQAAGTVQAVVPRAALAELEHARGVSDVAPAPLASADAVTSLGVARVGADELQAGGARGAGVRIAVLDTAFGNLARLDSLAGSELPPLERQHRRSFDATYGLMGRNFNGDYTAHGEEVAEVTYDVAPDADYWLVNYRTSLEFGQAVDYLLDEVHPDVVVHSNSFLFGPFDGTGWFAQQVDRAATAGVLWVNSAGNYRLKHWEGTWSDADGDGALDIQGHGDAIPFAFGAADRPACDISWSGADAAGSTRYELGLFTDAAGAQAAVDPKTGQPIRSSYVPEPDPHSDLGPAHVSAAGTYYLRITRVGSPPPTRLTLFCRQELPPDVDVTASSSPTPGDAHGALSVGAFDVNTLTIAGYSTEGPTDDGRMKPDIAAPTAVGVDGGYFTGTSAAAPHVAGAAALLWEQVAVGADNQTRAARVAARLRSLALDAGDIGADARFGLGRTRIETTPPELGAAAPVANAAVRGIVPLRLPLLEAGTLDAASLSLDGAPLAASLGSDRALTASFDSHPLMDGVHHLFVVATDKAGNAARIDVPLRIDNTAPTFGASQPRAGATIRGVARLRVPVVETTGVAAVLAVDARAVPSSLAADGAVVATIDTRLLADGPHRVTVTATDEAANSASFELPLVTDNTAPTLTVRAPASARVGARVRVTARASDTASMLDGRAVIKFGDGKSAAGPVAVHRYRRRGVYRISVTARDRAGNVRQARRVIRIRRPPTPRLPYRG